MTTLLGQINSPEDLRRIDRKQLQALAVEIRSLLLETLAKTGGHLGANLGVVELTIALHYTFNSPQDRFIWDVSHQCYVHKLLTGRRERFHTLRQLDGLSGFSKRNESDHDAFDAGHGGTSISAALGMARAREITRTPGRVIAIIGDGALTSGMALEALNDAGHGNTDLLVVLNDNAMSISPNVGALAGYLSRLRSEPSYLRAKARFEAVMHRLPGGASIVKLVDRVKAGIKQLVTPGMLFEDLGFTYIGPVDGHDINALLNNLQRTQRLKGPVLLHVLTTKGKGYSPAENHRSRLHGVPAFDLVSGEPITDDSGESFTEAFGKTMCRHGEENDRLVAICAAMCDGTGLHAFQQQFPARFFDVGMSEEHAVTLAAGMACEGLRPVVAVYSTFFQRAYDQLAHDVCMQNLPITFALDRAGLVGEDGPTHHGVFDLSFLRMLPNITVMAPATLDELDAMLKLALRQDAPCAIRYPRGDAQIACAGDLATVAEGRAAIVREGKDILLLAVGSMLPIAIETAELLGRAGISAGVVNARFVKPLDQATILKLASTVRLVVTLEENAVIGGFGSAVNELLASYGILVPICQLGIPDHFVEHGSRKQLLARLGLDARTIAKKIQDLLSLQDSADTRSTTSHG